MKKLIFTFMMCVFAIAINAQTMQDSYNVENTSKDELWRRAKDFCLSRHDFTLNTIQTDTLYLVSLYSFILCLQY